MNLGDALLAAGSVALLLSAVSAASARPAAARLGRAALRAGAFALMGALLWLALHFLLGWTDVRYVWDHTSTGYPWWYRLAGLWAGEQGTVLLWGALVALFALAESGRARPERLARGTRAVLALLAFALALLALLDRAFGPTPADLLAFRPGGQGLVEVLVTPLMVVHPPVQFVAYALVAVPAALAAAGLWTGERWHEAAVAWARLAWLVATIGLGLGAIWAYYVLSFGGFWAWDPVEVANLLPWLALTAFLHAARDRAGVGAPALAVAALALTLFATLSTRSGLWVSVHAFTDPADRFDPDAAARFVAILDAHLASALFAGLLAAWLAVAAAAFGRALLRETGARWLRWHAAALAVVAGAALAAPAVLYGALFEVSRWISFGRTPVGFALLGLALVATPGIALYLRAPERPRRDALAWVATAPLLKASAGVLSLGLVVAFVLDLAVVNGADRSVFDARAPFVGIPVVALVALAFGHPLLGAARALAVVAAALGTGVALAFVSPWPWPVAVSAPMLAVAFVLVLARAVQALGGGASRARLAGGAALLLAGVVGVVLGANPPQVLGIGFAAGAVLVLFSVAVLAGAVRVLGDLDGASLRRAGIHVVHLGLVVGLAGFVAATYASASGEFALAPGEHAVVGDVDYALVEVRGERAASPPWRVVEARLVGADGDEARAAFEWRGEPIDHYDPILDVRRGLFRDVYVSPHGFEVRGLGMVREHTTPALGDLATFAPENVERAHFDVIVLPLMSFVWGGLWTLVAGMGMILAGGAVTVRRA